MHFVILFLIGSFIGMASPWTGSAQEIAVLTSADLPVYVKAVQGFQAALPSHITVTEYQFQGDPIRGRQMATRAHASNPDVVLAVGLKAALAAKVEIVDSPVIFCMVLNPQEFGLPSRNMTGILMQVPPSQQLASLQTSLPSARHVGLLFDKAKSAAFVAQAHHDARRLGITLRTSLVTQPEDVPQALHALLTQVDALWLIRDHTVVNQNSFQFIMDTALELNTPVFGFSSGLLRYGAFASLSLDYERLGRQAAHLALNVIKNAKPTNRPQLVAPDYVSLALNLNAADFLGLTPTTQALRVASELFGGPGTVAAASPLEESFLNPQQSPR